MNSAKPGDRVRIHLTGRTSDGVVFESTEGHGPLQVEVGSDRLIPGLRAAIVGMGEGEERTVVVPPEEGYGSYKPDSIREAPIELLPEGLGEGDKVLARLGGDMVEAWIKKIESERVILDENHPLAGETLGFDIKLVAIEERN
jgi:peptidylprolyl isomerase